MKRIKYYLGLITTICLLVGCGKTDVAESSLSTNDEANNIDGGEVNQNDEVTDEITETVTSNENKKNDIKISYEQSEKNDHTHVVITTTTYADGRKTTTERKTESCTYDEDDVCIYCGEEFDPGIRYSYSFYDNKVIMHYCDTGYYLHEKPSEDSDVIYYVCHKDSDVVIIGICEETGWYVTEENYYIPSDVVVAATNDSTTFTNEESTQNASFNWCLIGSTYNDTSGLSVTVNSFIKTSDSNGIYYTVNYTLTNNVADKSIDEGTFKIFYADGSSEPQYGLFGTLTSGQSISRTYTWTQYTDTGIIALEYNSSMDDADMGLDGSFFREVPRNDAMHWTNQ